MCVSAARVAAAQQPEAPPPANPPGTGSRLLDQINQRSLKSECKGDYCILTGQVELPLGTQTTLFADQIEMFRDTNRLIAQGNVVFSTAEGRLSAERLDYDVATGTGTFTDAAGLMSLGAQADRKQFGNQDADVYFYGEKIERLGPKRYRLTNGAFTTCVQPTPRWEVASGTVTLNLNDYALANNTILRVKGVPVLYLPIIFYPIREEQRSTGFLLPTYGTSTVRGQAISNAFFWAINRSTDATFFHDWFTKAGQGTGAEYRYVAASQSMGDVRFYRFNQNQTTYVNDDTGQTQTLDATQSYEVTGNLNHALSRNIRARARLDYFTDLVTQQLYNQNLYAATRNRRLIEAGLTAGFGPLMTSMLYQHSELLTSEDSSQVYGSTPRVSANLAPQRLFRAPVYASANAEYSVLPNRVIEDGVVISDNGYSRLDVSPNVRVPLSKLTFLSLNTSAAYRGTYYTHSAAVAGSSVVVDDPYLRQYLALRSEVIGPVFNRIWDLQGGFAERVKHVIEPALTVDFTSNFDDFNKTPTAGSDVADFVVSGATKLTYGLTNRLFARQRAVDGVRGSTRELLTVGLQQTYYSNPLAGGYDTSYQSADRRPTDLSPLAFTTRFAPTATADTNVRMEYDVARGRGLQIVSVGGSLNRPAVSAGANFSHNRLNPENHSTFIQGSTSMRWLDGRATGTYNISWDIGRSYIVSQGAMLSYLAQCCGLTMEFQKFNYASLGINLATPSDMRFNFGFTLAGLGTIPSNVFGAFGGGNTR